MRQKKQAGAAKDCVEMDGVTAGTRAARKKIKGAGLRVLSATVIATRKVGQARVGTWKVVMTPVANGTFLIRRRKNLVPGQCPLLCYEVRRLDVGGDPAS